MYFACYDERWDSPKLRIFYENEKQRYNDADSAMSTSCLHS